MSTSTERRPTPRASRRRVAWGPLAWVGLVVGVGLVLLAIVFAVANRGGSPSEAGSYAYQVGQPGPGEVAPPIRLPSTTGEDFELGTQRGETVLLYFQEGLGCQPCWDQLRDIEANLAQFSELGIDQIVSITTDPIDLISRKVAQDGISLPVLSDPELAVSRAYSANRYGMMGDSRDGHSFILVGTDGRIVWRADYGGAPNYTMFLPSSALIADIRASGVEAKG